MPTVAQPDVLGAVIGHLLADTVVTTITSTRIGGEYHEDWMAAGEDRPRKALQLRQNGDVLTDPETRRTFTRIDVRCYGQTGFECMKVWNVTKPALCPGSDGRNSFTRKFCRIYGISHESGPFRTQEPDTKWPVVVGAFVVEWSEVPALFNTEGP